MRVALLSFVLAAATCACGAGEPERPPPRLVVLLATCTLRRDALGAYDPAVTSTPRFTELAAESVVMERHATESGQSGTDFAALFTGLQADGHGVHYHPRALGEELELVGEVFARAGYETWFFGGHRMAGADLGYAQGVPPAHVVDVRGKGEHHLLQAGNGALARLIERMKAEPVARAFVLANLTHTHEPNSKQVTRADVLDFVRRFPALGLGVTGEELDRWWPFYEQHRFELQWNLPDSATGLGLGGEERATLARVLAATYRTAVAELDRVVGELVAALRTAGLWDETLFCFTADHGEALDREGLVFHWTHGLQLAPEILDVPWILHAPGVPPGRYPAVTRSIDVLPTLAGLCEIELASEPRREGVDLSRALRGTATPPELLAFSHTNVVGAFPLETFAGMEHVLALYPRTDPALCWTRVREGDRVVQRVNTGGDTWRTQVFDLASDPLELHDLADPTDARQRQLETTLEEYKQRLIAGYARTQGRESADEEDRERLKDLGYAR